jgi:hypothetical protein
MIRSGFLIRLRRDLFGDPRCSDCFSQRLCCLASASRSGSPGAHASPRFGAGGPGTVDGALSGSDGWLPRHDRARPLDLACPWSLLARLRQRDCGRTSSRCFTIESEISPRHCEEPLRRSNPCLSEGIDGLLRCARNDGERAASPKCGASPRISQEDLPEDARAASSGVRASDRPICLSIALARAALWSSSQRPNASGDSARA